jgi:hypothetical protein
LAGREGGGRRRFELREEEIDGLPREDRIVPARAAVVPVTPPVLQDDDERLDFLLAQCVDEHDRARRVEEGEKNAFSPLPPESTPRL